MNSEDDLLDQGISAKGALPLLCMKHTKTFRNSLHDILNCLFKKSPTLQDKPSVTLLVAIVLRALKRGCPEVQ